MTEIENMTKKEKRKEKPVKANGKIPSFITNKEPSLCREIFYALKIKNIYQSAFLPEAEETKPFPSSKYAV